MSRARRPGRWHRGALLVTVLSLLAVPTVRAADAGRIAGQVRVSPLLVSLELSSTTAAIGQTVQARATIANIGPSALRQIAVALRADPGDLRVTKGASEIGQLKAGRSVTVTWSICGRTGGGYVLLARATLEGTAIDSAARLLTITPGGRKSCP